ncbi:MAG: CDP-alcohol phosphatidyltransferase family protein [Elusimicrobiota bacterium]
MVNDPPAFERVILWVPHPKLLWVRIGGMTVLERHLFTIARAGLKQVQIADHEPAAERLARLRLPARLEITWVKRDATSTASCAAPYLSLSGDHFLRVDALAFIARETLTSSRCYEDDSKLSVITVVMKDEDVLIRDKHPLPRRSYKRLEWPHQHAAIIDWIMASGPKKQDGFMARHFDRHLSLAASRKLLETSVTPNQMTVFSTLLGLLGCSFFLGDDRLHYAIGSLLVLSHSILDGCDGELARVRFQESDFGSDLDFWGDNIVHLALFSCLGIGFWRTGNGPHTLVLSALADIGVLASALAAWHHRRSGRQASVVAPEAGVVQETSRNLLDSRLARLGNLLAQRDFIYLLVVLSFVDMVYEFLWAAAIGGLLYFAIILHLRRVNEHEQARQPHPAR